MSLERGAFQFGNSRFPLASSTAKSLLEDADPAIFHALGFLSWAFDNYFGTRLKAQAQLNGLNFPKAVVTTAAIEPVPFLFSDQFRFPSFHLWRARDQWAEQTMVWDKSTSTWEFAYVLPPLTPVQARELTPILRSASVTLRRVIHMGFDPGYKGGEKIWNTAKLQKAALLDVSYGGFEHLAQSEKFYRAISGTISVIEREMPVLSAYDPFDGVDADLNMQATDGTVVDFGEVATYAPPSITSILPKSGKTAGGTLVTIAGSGFRLDTRPSIFFDGAYAPDVNVLDSSTITCRTPPHAAYPSFEADVLVRAPGQKFDGAELAKAFRYDETTLPETLPCTLLLRDFEGGVWSGTASAGPSGSRSAMPVGAGATASWLNGRGVATLTTAGHFTTGLPLSDFVDTSTFSMWALVKIDTVDSANIFVVSDADEYLLLSSLMPTPALQKMFVGNWSDDSNDYDDARVDLTLGSWMRLQARFNGSSIQMRLNSDPWVIGPTTSSEIGSLLGDLLIGRNAGTATSFSIAEVGIANTFLSDDTFDGVDAYLDDRYFRTS